MNYDFCLEVVNKLEAVRENKLQNSLLTHELARVMCDYAIADLRYLNELVQSLIVSMRVSNGDSMPEVRLTAHTLLTSIFLEDSLSPRIKAIRKTYFGAEKTPFGSLKDARKWMDRQVETTLGEREMADPLSSGSPDKVKYWELMKIASKMSRETGLSGLTILRFILADIKPLSVPYEIRTPGKGLSKGSPRQAWWIDVRINTEVSFDDLLQIYKSIKGYLGVKKGKKFDVRHLELYRLVKQRGGESQVKGTVVSFWKSIMDEWNTSHPNNKYETWKGVKIAYERTISKLRDNKTKEGSYERSHRKEG